jgi:zinc and cadmium transporter
MTLAYIVAASLAGGFASAILAALIAWRIQPRLIPLFVSFAVGALLGVVFLDLMPHIFEQSNDARQMAGWILAGILAFFVLEKLVLWRHDHDHAGAASRAVIEHAHQQEATSHQHEKDNHQHADGHHKHPVASAWMIIIGDGFHNFTDGFAIAAAFVADTRLGIVTALAIVAHELPQELSDFLVLLNAGFSKSRALFWNLVSSLATLVGALIAYFAIQGLREYSVIFLCLAAASMIYVAIADLMPGLHARASLLESIQQVSLIALGVLSIAAFHYFGIH